MRVIVGGWRQVLFMVVRRGLRLCLCFFLRRRRHRTHMLRCVQAAHINILFSSMSFCVGFR